MNAAIHRFTIRGPRLWKVLDGALDMLPGDGMTDAQLVQWIDFVEQALRRYYDLPPKSVSVEDTPEPKAAP